MKRKSTPRKNAPRKTRKKDEDSSPKYDPQENVHEEPKTGEIESYPISELSLDPSEINNVSSFQEKFQSIATKLMNSYVLQINGKPHRLAELEFYLKDENHPDIFTHCGELQLSCGQWYFHRVGKGYKGGSYKGLDITFSTRGYGGILIRAIMDLSSMEYVEGPSNVVDHILSLNPLKDSEKIPEVAEFVCIEGFHLEVNKTGLLFLRPSDELEQKECVKSGRVGLVLRTDPGVQFVMKPYRFMIFPHQVRHNSGGTRCKKYDSQIPPKKQILPQKKPFL
eukprot:TRINITY_DN3624_c0_g2_i2.p1 TRINITY_DN3624_c0_g2~~TRINITY_DN3624_c0_g2_i2.p1  ORF type:complete len:280 (+),score=36.02 TRINITY_DN3624_c0_g2_i2:100-939(+)